MCERVRKKPCQRPECPNYQEEAGAKERERESKIRVKLKLVPGLTGSHNLHTLISPSSVPVAVFKYRLVTASLSWASFCVTALLGQIC